MSPDTEDESDLAAKERIGRVLAGKWRLEKLLGVGGMAAVYEATHTNNAKHVAIKVLHTPLSSSAELKRRFLREGYIANNVGHPGALSVIDDGSDDDGTVFLIMELLEGESVRARANRKGGRIEAGELLPIIDGVLDILAAAHKNGIVHRDLKADNIFVLNDGTVKVLDFGIARLLESEETKTRTGMVMGTPEYMAPEQARGRSELVDGRADLWAIGAMIFRHLTGRHVHEAETTNEVLLLAMTKSAPKLAHVMPNAPPALVALVDKALAFERDDRWPDATAMQAATREALQAVRELEGARTLVGTPSPLDLSASQDESAGPERVVSVTAVTESSESSLPPTKTPPSIVKDELPIIKRAPRRKGSSGRMLLFLFGATGIGSVIFFNHVRSRGSDDVATNPMTSDNIAPHVIDAATVPGVHAPAFSLDVIDGSVSDLVDGGEDLDADLEDDDGGYDEEDEEDVVDAAKPTVKRPAAPTKKKAAPKRHVRKRRSR